MSFYQKRTLPDGLKQAVRQRDENRCVVNNCPSWDDANVRLNIHHVLPEKYGGLDDPSNLITLCNVHHKAQHVEFHAYYPDSLDVFNKMWHNVRSLTSKIDGKLNYGEYYDYKAVLEFLTGHRSFRGGQGEVFRAVMQGRDVLFVAPTGIGKSITYQLPGLIRSDPTLVVSPLKSLMKDQVEGLLNHYVPATYVNGDLGQKETQKRISFIAKGLMKFVYIAPERYFKSPKSKSIFTNKYGLLVIDEAHCIDKWGRHFRQDYGDLDVMRRGLGSPQTIAVTASASATTQAEIVRSLGLQDPVVIVKGFLRPNIAIHIYKGNKNILLDQVMDEYAPQSGKTIFYVGSVKEGERLQGVLLSRGREVEFYHGQLAPEEKSIIQNRFSGVRGNDPIDMIIATSAFGMGIDIPNIRLVIHWNIPGNIEDYYQQIGRAGRDGGLSDAVLLYESGDEGLPRYINERSIESNNILSANEKSALNERLDAEVAIMLGIVDAPSPWGYILSYFGDQGAASRLLVWWHKLLIIMRNIVKL